MTNLKKRLEDAVSQYGEPIEAIVVGQHDNTRYTQAAGEDENVLLPVDEGMRKLDYEYDSGYGGADCHPFYAWTASRVFFVQEYDGATGVGWVPRNPIAIPPSFSGE